VIIINQIFLPFITLIKTLKTLIKILKTKHWQQFLSNKYFENFRKVLT